MHCVRDHGRLHRGGHLRHRRQPGRQRGLHRRSPGPAHHHRRRNTPVDLLHGARLGDGGRSDDYSPTARRLGPPGGDHDPTAARGVLGPAGAVASSRRAPASSTRTRPATRATRPRPRSSSTFTVGTEPDPSQSPSPAPMSGTVWSSALLIRHRRRLGQPGRHLRRRHGALCARLGRRGVLHRSGHLRHRRQPGRQSQLRGRTQVQGKITVIRVPQYRGISSSFSQ